MNIKELIKAAQKPELYTPGTASMWQDAYISSQLLQTHLSQHTDLASRKETTIVSTVDWITSKVPGESLHILDLGCGPGLYTEKFAEQGHVVTGMDFSAQSIDYAKKSAQKKELNISYLHQDYLQFEEINTYDLIVMIFTDFCVLTPEQRCILLHNIQRALKPGGKFLFDVLNEQYPSKASTAKGWELAEKGFWRKNPYVALQESFYYPEQKVSLNQHLIIDETRELEVYRFWIHTFSSSDLTRLMAAAGFKSSACFERVIPDSDFYSSDSVTFCIATQ